MIYLKAERIAFAFVSTKHGVMPGTLGSLDKYFLNESNIHLSNAILKESGNPEIMLIRRVACVPKNYGEVLCNLKRITQAEKCSSCFKTLSTCAHVLSVWATSGTADKKMYAVWVQVDLNSNPALSSWVPPLMSSLFAQAQIWGHILNKAMKNENFYWQTHGKMPFFPFGWPTFFGRFSGDLCSSSSYSLGRIEELRLTLDHLKWKEVGWAFGQQWAFTAQCCLS